MKQEKEKKSYFYLASLYSFLDNFRTDTGYITRRVLSIQINEYVQKMANGLNSPVPGSLLIPLLRKNQDWTIPEVSRKGLSCLRTVVSSMKRPKTIKNADNWLIISILL
jgi:type II secretory pathway pseudopilin PulG